MINSVNEQLRELYATHYGKLLQEFDGYENNRAGEKPTNPLLIHIDDEERYQASDVKIMFFGQETYDWEGPCGKDIDHLLTTYKDFLGVIRGGGYNSPFWNFVRGYVKSVQSKNPDKKVDYIWNNILKVGRADAAGKPSSEIIKLQQDYFPVIKAEIEILQPDVAVFFTGPYYDEHIKQEFPDAEFVKIQDMKERTICEIHSAYLLARAFRTYHPGYLVRGKLALFEMLKDL